MNSRTWPNQASERTWDTRSIEGRVKNLVEAYGKQVIPIGADDDSGRFLEFLGWVGEWIEPPFLDEVEAPATTHVGGNTTTLAAHPPSRCDANPTTGRWSSRISTSRLAWDSFANGIGSASCSSSLRGNPARRGCTFDRD